MNFFKEPGIPVQDKADIIYPAILVIIIGSLYLFTLLPGIGYWGDVAEFQYIGKILGTTHPSGYPGYLLINHLFVSLFPIGSLAYKANLLSVLFSLLTLVILYKTIRLQKISPYISFISAMTFGLMYTFWFESVIAEVFTLNALFLSGIIYFLLKWVSHGNNSDLLYALFLFALSLGNHISMVFFLPGILFLILMTDHRAILDKKNILWVLVFAIIGASQYLYIAWRAITPGSHLYSPINSPSSFLSYVTGTEYQNQIFSLPLSFIISDRIPWITGLFTQELLILIPFVVIGIFLMKERKFALFLLIGALIQIIYYLGYNSWDSFKYFIPSYYIALLFSAIALSAAYEYIRNKTPSQIFCCISLLFLLIPGLFLVTNYEKADQSGNVQDARAIETLLKTVDGDAIYIDTSRDWSIAQFINYYVYGEGWQPKNITYWYTPEKNMERVFQNDDIPVYCSKKEYYEKFGFILTPVTENLYRVHIPAPTTAVPSVILNRWSPYEGFYLTNDAGEFLIESSGENNYTLSFDAQSSEQKQDVTIFVNKIQMGTGVIKNLENNYAIPVHLLAGKNSVYIIMKTDQKNSGMIRIHNIRLEPAPYPGIISG